MCGVATAPKIPNGRPSQELDDLIERWRTSDSRQLLDFLRRFWLDLGTQLSSESHRTTFCNYLSAKPILCSDGALVELRSTFLLSPAIRRLVDGADLPLLPVSDPDANWDFLREFGVSTTVDGAFFLKRLLALAQTPNAEEARVAALYKQLEARFKDSAGIGEQIRYVTCGQFARYLFLMTPVTLSATSDSFLSMMRGKAGMTWSGTGHRF